MPILKHSSVQILFGEGDIAVSVRCSKDRSSGAIQFSKIDPIPVGTKIEPSKTLDLNEVPVTLGFNKVESLDVVINQLQKLRDIMSEEGKYEWTDSGRIIEKNKE